MNTKINTKDSAVNTLTSKVVNSDGIKVGGIFQFECFDKDGNLKWSENQHNMVVNAGLDALLDIMFHATTQITTWYVGLKGTGTIAAGDTLLTHTGWTEITAYTGTRQAYVEAASSSQSMTNSASPASFAITGTATVAGAFLASATSGTTGTLFAAVDFAAARSVANGDTLNVTYTLGASDEV